MASSESIIASLSKKLPDKCIRKGADFSNVQRIPTGFFTFDLGTGGGYPQGRISINYGTESSTKSLHAYKAMAYVQKHCLNCHIVKMHCICSLPRHKKAVLLDIENVYDPIWGHACGLDNNELIVVCPDYAEQAVDIADELSYADDVGIMVIDSVAAMTTFKESENSAETASVGGNSVPVSRMVKKIGVGMQAKNRDGDPITIILINQIRHKIGVMFGDPETMSGGNSIKFASSLTTRFYGKDIIIADVNKVKPVEKEISCIIKKWKVPIFTKTFSYNVVTTAHSGQDVGSQPSWSAVKGYLTDYGTIAKKGTKWQAFDDMYAKLGDIEDRFLTDEDFRLKAQNHIIGIELGTHHLAPQV